MTRCSSILPCLLLLLAVTPLPAYAHPPVALVMDGRGAVYYSDLENVWVIEPGGEKSVAVAGVHTHELYLDARGHLYGEDVTNVGESYRHRVWARAPDGTVTNVLPWRDGHPVERADYAFVRDEQGRSYVLRRGLRRVDVLHGGKLERSIGLGDLAGFIHWATLGAGGDLLVAVGADAYRIPAGAVTPFRLAGDLVETTADFSFVHARHALMGLWTDPTGAVFIAVFSGQVVKKIAPDGEVVPVYRSAAGWSPAGGLVAPDGALWILEWSTANRARVQRVGPDGGVETY
jgi:hypothetical protein